MPFSPALRAYFICFVLGALSGIVFIQFVASEAGFDGDVFLFFNLVWGDAHVEHPNSLFDGFSGNRCLVEGDLDYRFCRKFVHFLNVVLSEVVDSFNFFFDFLIVMPRNFVRTAKHDNGALGLKVLGEDSLETLVC